MANKHLAHDLRQMQSLPLEAKIIMTQQRIRQWYEYWDGMVYVSFSGGKDSTVLKHIVDGMYDDVPALFVNTGLEYPEIQKFAMSQKNVVTVRPEMRFDEVIRNYGYPVVSKMVANKVAGAKPENLRWRQLKGTEINPKTGEPSQFNIPKWGFLLDAPFNISDKCCAVMKKAPAKKYTQESGRKPMLGLMADESNARYTAWLKTGCNAFDLKEPQSQPMAFWTEQDILRYLKKYDVEYCSVYGEIVPSSEDEQIEGQLTTFDVLNDYEGTLLKTTGCKRTGCIFCMFGCHLEKQPNRFQILKETHPKQYKYCIEGGQMVDGKLQPNKEGLGLGKVLDYIGVNYK